MAIIICECHMLLDYFCGIKISSLHVKFQQIGHILRCAVSTTKHFTAVQV